MGSLQSLFYMLTILTSFAQLYASVHSQCVEEQQLKLIQLKKNLVFEANFSTKLTTWNSSTDCCIWHGVTCNIGGLVVGLDLSNESIFGGLDNSTRLFQLQYLESLNLALNRFVGQIPSGFGKLINLRYLNLSYAQFGGQIPIDISQLRRLVTLDLSVYSFFPVGLPSLKLEIPNLLTFVRNLTMLKRLYLDGVDVGKDWSQAISYSLPNLRVLSLSYSNLSGSIDSSIANLQFLSELHLAGNFFFAPVPKFFANFSNLIVLDLSYSELIGSFPETIFQLPSLEFLDLLGNEWLHGYIPEFRQNLSLHTLVLSWTNFSGILPDTISNLVKLSRMELASCNFEGKIPSSITNLTALVHLDFSRNMFSGPLPSFHLKDLTYLDFSSNQLSSEIPSTHLEGLLNLSSVDLSGNSFTGKIPSSLFAIPSLQMILLSFNQFGGQIPDFSNESSLSLNTLDLSSNNLEGPIPESMGQLSALYSLSLSHNAFTGMIPSTLGNLLQLEYLDLSNNQLTGKIPQQLAGLTLLSFLNLSNNRLVGRIPAGRQLQSFPPSSYQGNEGLYGPPLTEICSDSNAVQRLCELPPSDASGKETSGHSSSSSQIDWNFIAAEVGYVIGLGAIFVPLMLWKRWRIWYNGQVECIIYKVFPSLEAKSRNRTIRSPRNTRSRRQ